MAIIRVTRQELVEANLEYLLMPPLLGDSNVLSEMYYWHTDQKEATICLLAGIGTIMVDKNIDNPTS